MKSFITRRYKLIEIWSPRGGYVGTSLALPKRAGFNKCFTFAVVVVGIRGAPKGGGGGIEGIGGMKRARGERREKLGRYDFGVSSGL